LLRDVLEGTRPAAIREVAVPAPRQLKQTQQGMAVSGHAAPDEPGHVLNHFVDVSSWMLLVADAPGGAVTDNKRVWIT
jgi:hypothetical protein